MLYYDRINDSEGIDVNKTRKSTDFDICHYWYFFDKGVKFQPDVCNGCHDVLMISKNLNDIATLNIHRVDQPWIINGINKSEAINLLQKADLNEKRGAL